MSKIYECPVCEDRDCRLNVCGLCHSITTILDETPGEMYSCNNSETGFNRTDYLEDDETRQLIHS